MFITIKRETNFFIYNVVDDKDLLLHYFDKELEGLSIQVPCVFLVEISENNRIGFRKKLFKLFKKINKLSNYTVIIGKPEMLINTYKSIERKIIKWTKWK